jgi:hypothetical protein
VKAPFALYQIHQGLGALLDRIDDADNPIQLAELVDRIGKLETDQTGRFLELRNAIINEEAKQDAIKAEIGRLDAMKKSTDRSVEMLKGAALSLLQLSGLKKVEFPTGGNIRVQQNSAPSIESSVPIEQLPEGWFETRTKVDYLLNRQAVIDAQALGTEIPKEITVTLGSHVRLK